MNKKEYSVVVIGGGPAGLAAATSAYNKGASTLLIEREDRLGGILKQCIHDGFGLDRFEKRLTGPEYAYYEIEAMKKTGVDYMLESFVRKLEHLDNEYKLEVENSTGITEISCKAIVFAMGCRERSARQIFIHGTRPAGVMTAGQAQYFINIQGLMPVKKAVILGSGDIGLIMARRLVLEGAEVAGVFEVKNEPSGLSRNIAQCLEDYNIPLFLSTTVSKVYGKERVEGVEVVTLDESFNKIPGSERFIECDSLVLSVGLIPENDILEPLGVEMDPATKGPVVDQFMHTTVDGAFSCGNALHVNDLADFVSESGEIAGASAADFASGKLKRKECVRFDDDGSLLYKVPQMLDPSDPQKSVFYFRSRKTMKKVKFSISSGDEILFAKKLPVIRPPEMERLELVPGDYAGKDHIIAKLEEV